MSAQFRASAGPQSLYGGVQERTGWSNVDQKPVGRSQGKNFYFTVFIRLQVGNEVTIFKT